MIKQLEEKSIEENEKNKNMIKQLEEKIVVLSNENNILRTQLGIINSSDLDKINEKNRKAKKINGCECSKF